MWVDFSDGRPTPTISERFAHKFHKNNTLPIGNVCCLDGCGQNLSVYWELPNVDRVSTVMYSKLFITQIANIITSKYIKAPIEVDGLELVVHEENMRGGIIQQKYTLTETKINNLNNVGLGHIIIDINGGSEVIRKLGDDIMAVFYNLNDSLFLESSKI